jgi:hypothetical protein
MDEQPVAPANDVSNDEVRPLGARTTPTHLHGHPVCWLPAHQRLTRSAWRRRRSLRSMKDRLPYLLSSRSHALSQPIASITNAKTGAM